MGENWIEGEDGNPITEFAERFGLRTQVGNADETTAFDFDGRRLGDEESEGLDVRLGHRVRRVERGVRGCAWRRTAARSRGGAAIVTLPLGVLKTGTVRFALGIPARKREAFHRLGMGVVKKAVMKFSKAFAADRAPHRARLRL